MNPHPTLVIVVLYVMALILISLFFVKKVINSYEEYSLAGRSLGFVYIFFNFFGTWISIGAILGLAGNAFKWGLSQYWIIGVAYSLGFITGPLFLTRIRHLQLYTIGDFFALRFPNHEKLIRILVALIIIVRNITIIGAQFSALGFLFMISFGINFSSAVFMLMLAIVLYTSLSGMRGIAYTDIIQGSLQAISLPILLYFIYQEAGGWHEITSFYENIGGLHYLNLFGDQNGLKTVALFFIAPGLFFLVDDQTTWQRIYASKNEKVAFWGYLTPICVALLWIILPCFVGVLSKVFFPYFTAFPGALFNFIFHLPKIFAVIILISFLSAGMSTCDSYLLSCGLTFSRDIMKKTLRPSASEHELITYSRITILISGLLAFSISLIIYDIFDLYILGAFFCGSMIAVPYLNAWFSKRMNAEGVIAGIIAGGLCFFIIYFVLEFSNTTSMMISLCVNLCFSWMVALINKKPENKVIMETYYWSPKFKNVRNIPQ